MTIETDIRKIAHLQGKPGQGDALAAALAELETATRREPGCVGFTFYRALTEPDRFLLLEHFADADAFQAHLRAPHTQAFFAAQLVQGVQATDLPTLGRAPGEN